MSHMTTAKALYHRWIDELWTGKAVAAELVSDDFVGHWPNRDVRGPDELQPMVDETQNMLSDLMSWSRSSRSSTAIWYPPAGSGPERRRTVLRVSPATTSCGSPTADSSSTGRAPPPASVNFP
jgi:hypothetical protein